MKTFFNPSNTIHNTNVIIDIETTFGCHDNVCITLCVCWEGTHNRHTLYCSLGPVIWLYYILHCSISAIYNSDVTRGVIKFLNTDHLWGNAPVTGGSPHKRSVIFMPWRRHINLDDLSSDPDMLQWFIYPQIMCAIPFDQHFISPDALATYNTLKKAVKYWWKLLKFVAKCVT